MGQDISSTVGGAERVSIVDAYATTGTSPTAAHIAGNGLRDTRRREERRRYDTVHLLGPGAVGRALLHRFTGGRRRVVAVTDSTATLHDPRGLDPAAVAEWKAAGHDLRDHPDAHCVDAARALAHIDADILADCSSTDFTRAGWTAALDAALTRGACVAAAAKAAVCEAGPAWFAGEHRTRIGCNAVLGGTGRAFMAELPELQRRTRAIAIVGNASTTAIIEVIEHGGSLDDGIREAQRLGFLEPDPELDLRGTDAVVKLAIVAGIIACRRIDPATIAGADIRSVSLPAIRERARRNCTTRLIARLNADGTLRAAYEEVSRDSLLAPPSGRVVYEYRLARDERRIHIGTGLGADATAGAVWGDICALASEAAVLRPEVVR